MGNINLKIFKTEEIRIIFLTVIIALGIISFSITGYMTLEGWGFLDSLYQTVITISTVGFGEVNPISSRGRIVTIIVIILAFSLLTYFFSQFVTIMVEGRINTLLRGRKMEKKIAKLKDHFIICGLGNMGSQISFEFKQADVPFVTMDINPAIIERENEHDILCTVGDATKEEDLERCGIKHARGFVSVLSEDQDNVYAILTARGLNSNIRIVTRATEYESERKLIRAGADNVVSPSKICGSRITSMMLRPSITHFLDGLARAEEIRLTLIEIEVMDDSLLEGKTIGETGITDVSESIIVGLRHLDEPMKIRPKLDTKLQLGDQLVLMGRLDTLNRINEII